MKKLLFLFLFLFLFSNIPIQANAETTIPFLYFAVNTGNVGGKIYASNLTLNLVYNYGVNTVYNTEVDDKYFYIAGDGGIFQYWKTNITKRKQTTGEGFRALCVDDTYVYGGSSSYIYKYWKSNLTKKSQSIYLGSIFTESMKLDGNFLYVGFRNCIYKMNKDNLSIVASKSLKSSSTVYSIDVDDNYVYYADNQFDDGTRRVVKANKSDLSTISYTGSIGGIIYTIKHENGFLYVVCGNVRKYYASNMTLSMSKNLETTATTGEIYGDFIYFGGTDGKIYQYWKTNFTKKATSKEQFTRTIKGMSLSIETIPDIPEQETFILTEKGFKMLLNTSLFSLFFILGYVTNKKSGGAFLLLSGFLLIGTLLQIEIIYASFLIIPISIYIMFVGIRKWFF